MNKISSRAFPWQNFYYDCKHSRNTIADNVYHVKTTISDLTVELKVKDLEQELTTAQQATTQRERERAFENNPAPMHSWLVEPELFYWDWEFIDWWEELRNSCCCWQNYIESKQIAKNFLKNHSAN